MRLYVALALFEGCPSGFLNSPAALRAVLEAAVAAGPFTLLEMVVVPFSPQGITACAVVGESHVALHSWPESGRLFVDIASCSTLESVRRAVAAVSNALPEGRLATLDERIVDPAGAQAP
ncbi:S-adenosylmethionine decarboxylase [Sorangium cellulosum]|uniref:S-adenosylmethionine decarboxylase n=1 Tax=Sorangium cellulosum TaxID=56 RepID=A0A4P2Q6A1_SORCE|nr:S-adenosylmethionine decarboxylase [Sorangium cellulosum]AUX24608.1 S-adenosylmethionine decarboxylase [Sorangium cellulosum]